MGWRGWLWLTIVVTLSRRPSADARRYRAPGRAGRTTAHVLRGYAASRAPSPPLRGLVTVHPRCAKPAVTENGLYVVHPPRNSSAPPRVSRAASGLSSPPLRATSPARCRAMSSSAAAPSGRPATSRKLRARAACSSAYIGHTWAILKAQRGGHAGPSARSKRLFARGRSRDMWRNASRSRSSPRARRWTRPRGISRRPWLFIWPMKTSLL